ncbi:MULTISPECIES: restriction endonuclease [unclassified Acidovorax]|uniref:nSTAND3 domain-containing NTPase n=1 Tax=unclassified Acidovorax TaxID=2684926 RepID=UPI001C460117|nr:MULTISPECIES: restriction endonuclease [unclassified Acidovorax]MBV7461846.1 restriction endonuclease [Acidovorax sp. sif0632]MBV7466780.1 restriction endonuclease [Acidovorax sp. sif0613]
MTDYDFKTLNDKEFEALCTDLLSRALSHKFERFKPGKDAGVDGRYFAEDGSEVILQCKHWANTPLQQLITTLGRDEKAKLDKLKPSRYILAISNPLSRLDKKKISTVLSPHLARDSDIYGKEDLNDLLKQFPDIERLHYKLWLHSTNILAIITQSGIIGRSEFTIEQIAQKASRYALTENHKKAAEILNNLGVLIISGDPGIGKTTLAEHLCLQYAADGFAFVNVIDDISEAEKVFSKDTKQIFYFDDFLGRNYLEALTGHEGGHLAAFIRRISTNKLKKFILTSRSTILNQGKFLIDAFHHENLKRNEYELRIDALSAIDKARILYNHIWHSGLSDEFKEEFYRDKRYRVIIEHKNFNPRLISFITDPSRRNSENVSQYWPYIEQSLSDPSHIWGHSFDTQADPGQRAIVLLVVLNGKRIQEQLLANAFHRLADRPGGQTLRGSHDFGSYIRLLTGSFLSRFFLAKFGAALDLFNPSIGDFVLKKYSSDPRILKDGVAALRSINGLATILNIRIAGLIADDVVNEIFRDVLAEAGRDEFYDYPISFVAKLCQEVLLSDASNKYLDRALEVIIEKGAINDFDPSLNTVRIGLGLGKISGANAVQFVMRNLEDISSDDDISDATAIVEELPSDMLERDSLANAIYDHVVELASNSLDEFIEVTDAFYGVGWEDTDEAEDNITKMIEEKFSQLGIEITRYCARDIAQSIDIENRLQKHIMNSSESYDRDVSPSFSGGPDEVDDLFDRG